MNSFVIECLTCRSKLQVQSLDLLGTIINCPRCDAMVEIPESVDLGTSGQPDNPESSSWQPLGEENVPPRSEPGNKDTVDDYGYETDHKSGLAGRNDSSEDVVSYSSQLEQEARPVEEYEQQMLPTTDTWVSEKTKRRSRQLLVAGISLAVVLVITSIFLANRSKDRPDPAASLTTDEVIEQPDLPEDPMQDPGIVQPLPEVEDKPEPAIEPPLEVPMPPVDPAPPAPVAKDPPGLVAEPPGNAATTDDLAGALREFGGALVTSRPAPLATEEGNNEAGEEVAMPERLPIPPVDVEAGLAFPIADLEISEPISFHEFTRMFSRFGNFPITIDLDALAASDLQLDSPVQLIRKDTTIKEVLQLVTDAHQLALATTDGHLLIGWTEAARTQLLTVDYPVPGGPPSTTHDLAQMLRELFGPESWKGTGGSGTIQTGGEILRVLQTRQQHYQLGLFLKQLNMARKVEPRAEPSLPRVPAASSRLSQPISLNFARETPLEMILKRLSKEAGMKFTVNWMATHAAGWSATSATTLVTDETPLSQVLQVFLDSLELDYRIVDATTIQVSTPEQLATESEVELHDIAGLLSEKQADEIVMLVQQMLGRDTAAGLIVDLPSQHLVVRASQADQVRIHQWLHPQP